MRHERVHLGSSPRTPLSVQLTATLPCCAAEGGDDLFAHYSNITDGNALQEGAKVEFEKVRARAVPITRPLIAYLLAVSLVPPCCPPCR